MRKFATIDGKGVISVEEGPIPEPQKGEILIEVHSSCISPGTELGGVKSRRANPNASGAKRPFGYQNAGDVIATGENCDMFDIGMRVACMGGGYALHATHACVPQNLSVPIPDGVTYQEAAFNHLAATALHTIRRAQLQICENVVVMGLGVVGQLCCQFAKLSGAYVMGVDKLPLRVKTAQEASADIAVNADEDDLVEIAQDFTRGYGMDCGIICFGGEGTEAFRQIVQMIKTAPDTHKWGRIVNVGGARISHGFAAALGNIDVRSAARTGPGYHDIEYEHGQNYPSVFVEWNTKRNLEECLRFIALGRLDVKAIITDEFPLDEAPEACEKLIQTPNESLGVILRAK